MLYSGASNVARSSYQQAYSLGCSMAKGGFTPRSIQYGNTQATTVYQSATSTTIFYVRRQSDGTVNVRTEQHTLNLTTGATTVRATEQTFTAQDASGLLDGYRACTAPLAIPTAPRLR